MPRRMPGGVRAGGDFFRHLVSAAAFGSRAHSVAHSVADAGPDCPAPAYAYPYAFFGIRSHGRYEL